LPKEIKTELKAYIGESDEIMQYNWSLTDDHSGFQLMNIVIK